MKRLFSRRATDRFDYTISPFTTVEEIEELKNGEFVVQKKVMEQTNGIAFQDISIGRKTRNKLRRERMTSLESDFRVSRVDISPLSIESNATTVQQAVKTTQNIPHSYSSNWQKHPFATTSEQARDISSAARAYLPHSSSFLTTTTTSKHFHGEGGEEEERSNFRYLNRQPSGEMNSWPSSILMHSLNPIVPPARLPKSSPTPQGVLHSDQISWRESLEQHLSLNRENNNFFGREATRVQEAHGTSLNKMDNQRSSSIVVTNRKISVPALRSASHAKRQRESMLVQLGKDEVEVDEFGQLIEKNEPKHEMYPTVILAKQDYPVDTLKASKDSSISLYTPQARMQNNRNTFGIMLDRNPLKSSQQYIPPRTPSPIEKRYRAGHPPTLGLDTPALIGSVSNFSDGTNFAIKVGDEEEDDSYLKSKTRRNNLQQTKDLAFPPSPHSGTFRFPALCLAAVDQAAAILASMPQTPNTHDKGRTLHLSPSVSLASARFETPSRGEESEQMKEEEKSVGPLLGSPIRLTSEMQQDKGPEQLLSRFSSSSESSMNDFLKGSEEKSEDPAVEEKREIWEITMKGAKSDTQIFKPNNQYKPQAFFESQSMPLVRLTSDDREACLPADPSSEDVFRHSLTNENQEFKQSEDSSRPSEQHSQSDAIVNNIIQQQQEAMQKLRNCSKWSPMKMQETGLSLVDNHFNSSWTWAATTDVSHMNQSEQSVQEDVSSMDKCVDWECNGTSHDAKETLVEVEKKGETTVSTTECKEDIPPRKLLVDKSTQTDPTPPPRPARSEARKMKDVKVATPRAPDICILLASPRRGDDQDPLDGLSINFGFGIITTDDAVENEDTMDESLLVPRALERDQDSFGGTLEVFEYEVNSLIETLSDPSISKPQRPTTVPEALDMTLDYLHSPPTSTAKTTTPFAVLHAPRDSTTTAAIEAMLEQLRLAQQSPKRLDLYSGGRRHEHKKEVKGEVEIKGETRKTE